GKLWFVRRFRVQKLYLYHLLRCKHWLLLGGNERWQVAKGKQLIRKGKEAIPAQDLKASSGSCFHSLGRDLAHGGLAIPWEIISTVNEKMRDIMGPLLDPDA
ncbi:hypothetical protein Dimus_003842, partial [Dionaea muscipula]